MEPIRETCAAAEAWRSALPSDVECVEAAVGPFRDMTADQRLRALAGLVASLMALAGGRRLVRDDDVEALWPRWLDPTVGGRAD